MEKRVSCFLCFLRKDLGIVGVVGRVCGGIWGIFWKGVGLINKLDDLEERSFYNLVWGGRF